MSNEDLVIRCRGLPWSCSDQMLQQFFSGLSGEISTCLTYNSDGRPTGEAYVQFSCENDYQIGLSKDKEKIGQRYIEIFPCKRKEMEYMLRHTKQNARGRPHENRNNDCIVKLRGLPFGCWEDDITHFFSGLDIAPDGILIITDSSGKQSGEAFVQFSNVGAFEAALAKNKESIGHRYVEVFSSGYDELERCMYRANASESVDKYSDKRFGWNTSRMGGGGGGFSMRDSFGPSKPRMLGGGGFGSSDRYAPYSSFNDNGAANLAGFKRSTGSGLSMGSSFGARGMMMGAGGGGIKSFGNGQSAMDGGFAGRVVGGAGGVKSLKHYVFMRGLPFKAGQEDVVQFFHPLRVSGVQFVYDATNRPSGEARAEFMTHLDAQEAMKRDRNSIGGRYIELFLESESHDDEPASYAMPMTQPLAGGMGMFGRMNAGTDGGYSNFTMF